MTSLDPKLLEVVVCPACHARLELSAKQESLACTGCRRVYPVRDGIPVLLIDQAQQPA